MGANSVYLGGVTVLDAFAEGGQTYQTHFYVWMFLGHVVLGLLLVVPFLLFAAAHWRNTRGRKNRRAVRVGYALTAVSVLVLVTGLLLIRTFVDLKHPTTRSVVYWLHVGGPLAGLWLYWLHRLVGPRMRWRSGFVHAGVGVGLLLVMTLLHASDPRWGRAAPESGAEYFEPSLARTADGRFIPAESLMQDEKCQRCHPDVHARWSDSVHRFSSFNNPAYLASVQETRAVLLERDGDVKASRWCAGCHDPVPFFSGRFDNPDFDVLRDPTASAGITCTVCHAVTHVNSPRGNADFVIEEPVPYPFDGAEGGVAAWLNEQLVKAKPSLHKRTFLKPLHHTSEFCSTCHKVHLPGELTQYKEFLRGQNHYDSFHLSGVSGFGARSFYYPPTAHQNCNRCHMPARESNDFGARPIDGGSLQVHDHLFPSANTAIAWLRDREEIVEEHRDYLQDVVRLDVFGLREGGRVDGRLHAPLRPDVPTLVPGRRYLLEVVIRTTGVGHHLTQGTTDSNELWLDVVVRSGDRVVGRSGGIDATRGNEVDPWAWFVNAFVIDREGRRIDRRNAQDIFTKLYDHQIPPGAATTVHYEFEVPESLDAPLEFSVALRYRKFDQRYMQFVDDENERLGRTIQGRREDGRYVNELPTVVMATDAITFPVAGVATQPDNRPRSLPEWERWNDFGIGLLLGGDRQLRQAEAAFREVERLGRWDGPLNLARVHEQEGDLPAALEALERAAQYEEEPGFPWWTWSWLAGAVDAQRLQFASAAEHLETVLLRRTAETTARGFDFSRDRIVVNELGSVLYDWAQNERRRGNEEEAEALEREAVEWFEKTLAIDPENVAAHFRLERLHRRLGNDERADHHAENHRRYKPDETAQGRAVVLAKERYPAANAASEEVVVHWLHRAGAPGLPPESVVPHDRLPAAEPLNEEQPVGK